MTIRAVFFDFGGVLYRTPDRSWLRRWQVLLGLIRDEDISGMILSPDESPFFQGIMEGTIPESAMWERMEKSWRLSPLVLRWLQHNTMNRRRLNREVVAFLAGLRPRYRTGILSNAGSDARRLFIDVFGFDRLVDTLVISAEEGSAKPDEQIYRVALDRLGVEPHETVFLDDLAVNVAAARNLGMHAVHFRDTRQALSEIAVLLE
jgi:epoxide hydrolase-like predicted phosphatase